MENKSEAASLDALFRLSGGPRLLSFLVLFCLFVGLGVLISQGDQGPGITATPYPTPKPHVEFKLADGNNPLSLVVAELMVINKQKYGCEYGVGRC